MSTAGTARVSPVAVSPDPKYDAGPLTFMPKVFLFAQFNAKITPRAYFGPAGAEVGRVQRWGAELEYGNGSVIKRE